MRVYYIVLLSIIQFVSFGQNKQDYIWHFGSDQDFNEEGVQASQINFNDSEIAPTLREGGLEFDRNNASICDKDGNLLIYSNGCAVANSLGQIMPNGDSINAGQFFDQQWLGDCRFGYPGRQDVLILPSPKNDFEYYLIHKTVEFQMVNKHLKYTKIDMSLDNGLGDVVEKNIVFFEGLPMRSYLTAILHQNRKDYWILNPKRETNVYYRFLLTENGIEEFDSLQIGQIFNVNASSAGDAKFSSDGSKYAIYNTIDGLQVFDFDRSTGEFSNPRLYDTPAVSELFSSLEFSPNSRFVYFMDDDFLWQIDLEDSDPESSIVLIAENNGTLDPFLTTFFLSALAPDCKIYIRGGSSANSMHVIKKPNQKGKACDFLQNAIRFPLITATGGFPNFPRFRVDDEEKCDPNLTSSIENIGWEVKDLHIYPNPASDFINLSIPDQNSGRVFVYNIDGQKLLDQNLVLNGLSPNPIGVSQLSTGSYIIEFLSDDMSDRIFYQGRLQVVR